MDAQRFMTHVAKQPTGCWHWTAAKRGSAYGQVKHEGRIHFAHRFSFQIFKGPIAPGMKVLHLCDNPICVNPEHLKLGNQSENITQCVERGRLVDNAGEKHGCARLTADQVISIRASNENHAAAGRTFGVNEATIRAIRQRKLWKHV